MKAKLQSTKLGISGPSDLYKITVSLHDDLKSTLANSDNSGETLRKEFAQFYHSFMGTKECSPEVAAAVTLLHASHSSQRFKLRISQALQAGIGLNEAEMEEQAAIAAKTGQLTDRKATHTQAQALDNGDWMGLLGLAVEYMCFASNKSQSFDEKRMALITADLAPFNRCSEALAHMLKLHQAAVTAFGSDFIPMYNMLTLIKKKLQLPVQYAV